MYSDTAYAPFGEPYAQAGTTDLSFTGQNQDTVVGNLTGPYDFPAREYGPQGRWLSPDAAGLAAVDPTNPQSLNRYAYVFNNPLNLIDPMGFDGCYPVYSPKAESLLSVLRHCHPTAGLAAMVAAVVAVAITLGRVGAVVPIQPRIST
jgi:RHS repeat-associated protein